MKVKLKFASISISIPIYLYIYTYVHTHTHTHTHTLLLRWLSGKESTTNAGDVGSILGQEDHMEEEMTTHSSFLPRESHGQRLVGSQKVRQD